MRARRVRALQSEFPNDPFVSPVSFLTLVGVLTQRNDFYTRLIAYISVHTTTLIALTSSLAAITTLHLLMFLMLTRATITNKELHTALDTYFGVGAIGGVGLALLPDTPYVWTLGLLITLGSMTVFRTMMCLFEVVTAKCVDSS